MHVFFLLMQTLPPRAPDLLSCALCVAWALFSQFTPLFGFVFYPLEDFRIFKKKNSCVFFIYIVIYIICVSIHPTPNTGPDSHWEYKNLRGGTSCCFTEEFLFFPFLDFLPARSLPPPLPSWVNSFFFPIFLVSSISFFSFYFMPEEFSFSSLWISPASIFPVSPLYSQNMDGLGGACFTEVHLDLLTDARWEEEMGTPVSGVGTNSKFFPQP